MSDFRMAISKHKHERRSLTSAISTKFKYKIEQKAVTKIDRKCPYCRSDNFYRNKLSFPDASEELLKYDGSIGNFKSKDEILMSAFRGSLTPCEFMCQDGKCKKEGVIFYRTGTDDIAFYFSYPAKTGSR